MPILGFRDWIPGLSPWFWTIVLRNPASICATNISYLATRWFIWWPPDKHTCARNFFIHNYIITKFWLFISKFWDSYLGIFCHMAGMSHRTGLSAAQSRDFGIGKFSGSRDSRIPASRDINSYLRFTHLITYFSLRTYLCNVGVNKQINL